MSATSDFMTGSASYPGANGSSDGLRTIVCMLQRLLGISMIAAASGLWVLPGADSSGDVMLMKMGLSTIALLLGFWLVFAVRPTAQTEVELDVSRSELRILRPGAMGAMLVVYSSRFDQLGRVENSENVLKFWDQQGEFLADVHVTEPKTMDFLVSGLLDAGVRL